MLSLLLMAIGITAISSIVVSSQNDTQVVVAIDKKEMFLVAAGIAVGLTLCGAGMGLGTAGAAAIRAIPHKPRMLGKTLLLIVFIQAIAIYCLAMFYIIYSKI